jgi:hypothetical protein
MTSEPVKHVLFITTIPDLQTPHYLGEHIAHVTERALERVVIVLVSPLFNGGLPLSKRSPGTTTLGVSHAGSWTAVQRILTYVYVKSSAAAQAKGRILLDIDVLLHGTDTVLDARIVTSPDVLFKIDGSQSDTIYLIIIAKYNIDELPIQHSHQLGALPTALLPFEGPGNQDTPAEHVTFATPSLYPVVALGGTFDHLHAGHKILLFMAAWISSWKVIVGITGAWAAFMRFVVHRISNVIQMMHCCKRNLIKKSSKTFHEERLVSVDF